MVALRLYLACLMVTLAAALSPNATQPHFSSAEGRSQGEVIRVVVQNLQKRAGLGTKIATQYAPVDVLLAQEIALFTEDPALFTAHHTSRWGYGTAIFCDGGTSNIRLVTSPYAETGGFIFKKTTVATCKRGVQWVSFHGYNGQPFQNVTKLVAHVDAVIEVLSPGPALFAGDFNTWSLQHVQAVTASLKGAGFEPAFSWPYPGRDLPLDHAFVRELRLEEASWFKSESDHQGAILTVSLM
mmetsp:Transcript_46160/g.74355  ORF Transcript_46160/g.74355 Transcript_46160/m.74355 type:complete len:241 (-) Transcript_46160:46-768(-)|eukprot:CAMPEP_0179438054 /NCGR_PEP_ID=MMETSP0799-20121207/21844_1 /TAXON_ID=46947 /ORGANISM="Geminigera cryophila, Strain CCMP2564" /LENGTH=240 /DNA_ID=CAMNT_0021219401 /DNA_START=22 /DNA_END=744 /DNA_ORIENTATION=-